MRAKSFFYVSLGILALALSFHLGAATASGQAVGLSASHIEDQWAVIVVGRDLYETTYNGSVTIHPGIPGSSAITACNYNRALLANGDSYYYGASGWSLFSTMGLGATPVSRQSFGALKAKYR